MAGKIFKTVTIGIMIVGLFLPLIAYVSYLLQAYPATTLISQLYWHETVMILACALTPFVLMATFHIPWNRPAWQQIAHAKDSRHSGFAAEFFYPED